VWGAHAAALEELGYADPASHWQALSGELRESARAAVGPLAEILAAEGRAVEPRRRLGWAIERAEQASASAGSTPS